MQDPQQPTPAQQAQVRANVAKMRMNGATEDDVAAYLAHESGQLDSQAAQPETVGQGFGRAMLQHGLMNFGDELGMVDAKKQDAWAKNHPIADFLATIGGGAAAPIAAVFAAPELATLGGAAALGGAAGLISGAGEQDPNDTSPGQMVSRSQQAAGQGIGGVIGGAAGHVLGSAAGKFASTLMDQANPARVVARNAAPLLEGVQDRMNAINKLAPGGASIANSSVAPGLKPTMMTTAVRGTGADPAAGAAAAKDLLAQSEVLQNSLQRIGAKIQQNEKVVPVTPEVRSAIAQARSIIGKYAPPVPDAPPGPGPTLPGFDSGRFEIPVDAESVTTTELHDALSRMRFTLNQMQKRGIDAPGQTVHDVKMAVSAMKKVLYEASPDIAGIDRQYGAVADQLRRTEPLVKAAQRSRMNYGGTGMTATTPSSVGSSITTPTKHSLITGLVNKLFVNSKKTAPEIQRFITSPGGSDAVAKLLQQLPASHPAAHALTNAVALTAGGGAGEKVLSPTIKGLMDPEEE